jgi:hypothetical protein
MSMNVNWSQAPMKICKLHMTLKNNKFIDMKFNTKVIHADSITIQVLVRLCHQYIKHQHLYKPVQDSL